MPSLPAVVERAGKTAPRAATSISISASPPKRSRSAWRSAGLSGLVAGIVIGGNKFIASAFEPYLYYLGPTPKIIFFPVMIMWFGVDSGSKIAMGTLSCFFPMALNVAAGMRQIDQVLIQVGKSFRANCWQMTTKIYLPAMRHPDHQRCAARARRRPDRHAARRDKTLQSRHRLSGHPGL